MAPDICIVNWYGAASRMGLHQDKDESPASLERGAPVVSISIGDTAKFLFGGVKRRDPVETLLLQSGDAFVFGGPARLRYHGVSASCPAPRRRSAVRRPAQPDVSTVLKKHLRFRPFYTQGAPSMPRAGFRRSEPAIGT